jgi:broad specificity phosphatase PhoE
VSTIIHLVRHGRIPNYDSDQSLTAEGREEALAVGRELAALVRPGETIRFFSSPARRARETAALLRNSLGEALTEMKLTATLIPVIEVDDRLQNNQFYINGTSYDLTVPLLDIVRWRLHENPTPQNEVRVIYLTEFWHAPDPVTYWLTHPHDTIESPEAVSKRVRACLSEHLAETGEGSSLRRDICVTHSANLRAFLQQVFGHDPGPPAFSGMLTISNSQVEYQGQIADFPSS